MAEFFGHRVRGITRRREWVRARDTTDVFPAIDDDTDADDDPPQPVESPSRTQEFGQSVVARLPQLGVVIVAGLSLCLSFPPFGWWYLTFIAFALLTWVLTRESTTLADGFGYGFLFGLAFYLPLL